MKNRSLLMSLCLVALLVLLGYQISFLLHDSTLWPPLDFLEYWGAGRLCLHGENPYSADLLLEVERHANPDLNEPVIMWNPPWTLTFVLPLGLLPPRIGQFVWLAASLLAMAASALLLGKAYFQKQSRWIPWVMIFTFMPTFFTLQYGQIVPLLLLGASLFAWAIQADRPFLAGAATLLLAIKPHLAFLVWLAIFVDLLHHRRWQILAGAVMAGIVSAILPLLFNPEVYSQYLATMGNKPPSQWITLTLGALLRVQFGEEKFWLQFVPMTVGIIWFANRWRVYGDNWNWSEQFPWLLLISYLTTPYGAWHFDLMLLLIPLMHLSAQLDRRGWDRQGRMLVAIYIAMNLIMLGISMTGINILWFGFVSPLVFLMYAVFTDTNPRAISIQDVRAKS